MLNKLASVRVRTTISATIVVAVALAVAGVVLVAILRDTLVDNVDSGLDLRSRDIAALIEGGASPRSIAIEGEEDGFAQIIGRDGTVLVASSNIEGEDPIVLGRRGTFDLDDSPVDEGTFRVRATATDTVTIVVGRSLEDVERTTRVITLALGVGLPALVLVVAASTWLVASRALRPVEAIRSEVADIGGSGLHRRVPEPTVDDEIGRLATTMNEMLDRLERASDLQRRFISDASHELRTPLATIRHELDLARNDPHADFEPVIDDVAEEALRMQRLVDDLLLLARHDHHRDQDRRSTQANHGTVDLDDLALVEAHRTRRTNITIDASGLSEAQVRGDADQLTRVIGNLIDNAIRHASHQVAVSNSTADDLVQLHVDDDGPGVKPGDQTRIFERFTRADDARSRATGGAGLGLAIVDELVKDHGGTIEVADSPFGGARFTVTLPLHSAKTAT